MATKNKAAFESATDSLAVNWADEMAADAGRPALCRVVKALPGCVRTPFNGLQKNVMLLPACAVVPDRCKLCWISQLRGELGKAKALKEVMRETAVV